MKTFLSAIFSFLILTNICFAQWFWQNPVPTGNNLHDVYVFDSLNCIIIGDMGTVIRTSDGGDNWTLQNITHEFCILESITFADEYNGWIVGYGNTYNPLIFKTSNGGITWDTVNNITNRAMRDVFFISPQIGWMVGNSGKVIKTTDGGSSWVTQNSSTGSSLLSVFFANENDGWAVGQNGTIISTVNGGSAWTNQTSGTSQYLCSVFFVDENYGWIVGSHGVILNTTDGGITWISFSIATTTTFFSVWFDNYDIGWIVSGGGYFYKTTNGGSDWVVQNPGTLLPFHSIQFSDSFNGWVVGDWGYIFKTTNGGDDWISQSTGNRKIGNEIFFINKNIGWASFYQWDGNEFLKTIDGGENWTLLSTILFQDFIFLNEDVGWALNSNSIFKTTDGGITWYNQMTAAAGLGEVYFLNQNVGWAVGGSGIVLKTTNSGNDWESLNISPDVDLHSVFFVNDSTGWIVGYIPDMVSTSIIKKTTNGGNSWISQSIPEMQRVYSVYALNENLAWVGGDAIAKTTDGGNNWSIQSGTAWKIYFSNENDGWAVNFGILRTTNGGEVWSPQYTDYIYGLVSQSFIEDTIGWVIGNSRGTILKTINAGGTVPVELMSFKGYRNENNIILNWSTATEINNHGFEIQRKMENTTWATIGFKEGKGTTTEPQSYSFTDENLSTGKYYYRLKQVDFDGTFKYSDVVEVEAAPTVFSLDQNYPNPFNPVTSIKYSISKDGNIKLKVYNALGQQVAELINKEVKAGNYEIEFNAKNLASGVYFYQLRSAPIGGQAGGYIQTKKMILIK